MLDKDAKEWTNLKDNERNSNRVIYYDVLRLLATLAVIMYHCSKPEGICSDIILYCLNWCVPIFCMLTGALFLNSDRNYTLEQMFTKYILRILAVLFLGGSIYNVISSVLIQQQVNIRLLFNAIWMVLKKDTTYCYHFWYLYLVIGLYILIPIIKPALDKWREYKTPNRSCYFCFGVLWLISIFFPTIEKIFDCQIWNIAFKPFSAFGFFLFSGYWVSKFGLKLREKILLGNTLIIISVVIIFLMMNGYTELSFKMYGYDSFVTWIAAVLLFDFFRTRNYNRLNKKLKRYIVNASNCSFGIYILHVAVLMGISKMWGLLNIEFNSY